MSWKYEDIRNFYFMNEKGEKIDCQNINGNLFFYNVSGLGYEEETSYEKVGNYFIENMSSPKQNQIYGDLEFYNSYDTYRNFVNFILRATKLTIVYVPKTTPRVEYYRDIKFVKIDKGEEDDFNVLTCPITFDCLTLWYEEAETVYTIEPTSDELRWNFRWASRFSSYDNRSIAYENRGHTEAPFKLQINGYVKDPVISIYTNGELINQLDLTGVTLEIGDSLYYSTKSNELYLYKISDGVKTNLFNSLSLLNTNFFKLPKGVSEIRLSADDDITSAKLTIFTEYKAV